MKTESSWTLVFLTLAGLSAFLALPVSAIYHIFGVPTFAFHTSLALGLGIFVGFYAVAVASLSAVKAKANVSADDVVKLIGIVVGVAFVAALPITILWNGIGIQPNLSFAHTVVSLASGLLAGLVMAGLIEVQNQKEKQQSE